MSLLAIGWDPEIRGMLTVVMAVVILPGSIYLVMATDLGSRLAFLVILTALFGWLMLMGVTWLIYGIGLRGPDPTWEAVPGATVLQDNEALVKAGILPTLPDFPDDSTPSEDADIVGDSLLDEGYVILDKSSPAFGQAQASASVFLVEEGAFSAGQFEIVEVFDIGGESYPKLNDTFDFFAFWHAPHYAVAEAAAYEPVRDEPGRAPAVAQIDETRQRQYVYMIRDLGSRRQPPIVLTIGAGAIFFALCFLLNRRERFLRENLAKPLPPVETDTTAAASSDAESGERVGASV
jgi:hypothetical protein